MSVGRRRLRWIGVMPSEPHALEGLIFLIALLTFYLSKQVELLNFVESSVRVTMRFFWVWRMWCKLDASALTNQVWIVFSIVFVASRTLQVVNSSSSINLMLYHYPTFSTLSKEWCQIRVIIKHKKTFNST